MYTQLLFPNTEILCTPGWCLTYVQDAFGTPWAGSSATDAWTRAQKRHVAELPPAGIIAPVYFSMDGEPNGHIVIQMADGSIYSTSHPSANVAFHHPNIQHLYDYYGGRLHLRGWSEDLNGTLIVKKEGKKMTEDGVRYGYLAVTGGIKPLDKDVKYWTGRDSNEFTKNI